MPVKATGWPSISRVFAPILRPLSPADNGLWTRVLWRCSKPQAVELAVEGGAADLQPPGHLGHLSAVMGDCEAYDLALDLLQGADVPRRVDEREPAIEPAFEPALGRAPAGLGRFGWSQMIQMILGTEIRCIESRHGLDLGLDLPQCGKRMGRKRLSQRDLGKFVNAEPTPFRQHHGPKHRILELAHVAGPAIRGKQRQRL